MESDTTLQVKQIIYRMRNVVGTDSLAAFAVRTE